jgi:hypothetical protein
MPGRSLQPVVIPLSILAIVSISEIDGSSRTENHTDYSLKDQGEARRNRPFFPCCDVIVAILKSPHDAKIVSMHGHDIASSPDGISQGKPLLMARSQAD